VLPGRPRRNVAIVPRSTLTTCDGLRLSGRRWLHAGTPDAAVVIVHGFTASGECPHVEALAERLHCAGLDIVTYDARGHGASDGESTLGDDEQHDVAAAVELARTRTDRVALVGASMGAIAALRYAVSDPYLRGAVLVSCPAQWRLPRNVRGLLAAAMTRTRPGRRVIGRLSGVRVASTWTDPAPPLGLVTSHSTAIAFVHGLQDRFIPPSDAEALFRAASDPKLLTLVPGMSHAFGPEAVEPIRNAVDWVLRDGA
jgi:pimeloyl-ACP methyl ester carboxylesterase